MGFRTTLLLLLVAGVLVTVLWLTDEKPATTEVVTAPVLGGHTLDGARKIRWQFAGQGPIEIRHEPGGPFRLTEPLEDLASVAHLRQIAAAYDSAQMVQTPPIDDPAVFAQTGLDTPELVFEVEFFDGQQHKLEIGQPGPIGTDRFARAAGKVWRVGEALLESVRAGVDDLRDRSVFTTVEPNATALTVERRLPDGGQERIRLQRQGTQWRLQEPMRSRADMKTATAFVRAILSLRIDQFPASVLRPPRPEPDWRVLVEGSTGSEEVRMWQDDQQNLFGMLPARKIAFASTNREYARVFETPIDMLRATMLVPFDNLYDEMAEVVVDFGADQPRVRIGRDTKELPFALREPIAWNADATEVNKLLTAINNLRAMTFLPGTALEPQRGLQPGGLQVGVRGFAEHQREWTWVRLGTPIPGQQLSHAARADEADQVVGVPTGAIGEIARPWAVYCARDVLRTSVAPDRVELHRGSQVRVLVRGEKGWVDERDQVVVRGMRDLVDELRDLRATGVVTAKDLGEPDWSVKLCRREGDELGRLLVWDRGPDAPLLVQAPAVTKDVAFELGDLVAAPLRALAPARQ